LLPALQTVYVRRGFAKTFEELKIWWQVQLPLTAKELYHFDSHPSMVLLVLMGIILKFWIVNSMKTQTR
jgi:hypothetical protein